MHCQILINLKELARFFREKSDYVDFYIVTREECEEQIKTAKDLIKLVEVYLNQNK